MVAIGGPRTTAEQAAPSLIDRSPCVVRHHAAEAARVSAPSASDEEWEHCVSIMNPWRIEVERPRTGWAWSPSTRKRRTRFWSSPGNCSAAEAHHPRPADLLQPPGPHSHPLRRPGDAQPDVPTPLLADDSGSEDPDLRRPPTSERTVAADCRRHVMPRRHEHRLTRRTNLEPFVH